MTSSRWKHFAAILLNFNTLFSLQFIVGQSHTTKSAKTLQPISLLLEHFPNCTTILVKPNSTAEFDLQLKLNPIILRSASFDSKRLKNYQLNTTNFRRRYAVKHCYLFVLLLPESDTSFPDFNTSSKLRKTWAWSDHVKYFNKIQQISDTGYPQYCLLLTTIKEHVKRWLSEASFRNSFHTVHFMEFVIVEVSLTKSKVSYLSAVDEADQPHFMLYYHNRLYSNLTMSLSAPWYEIKCFDPQFDNCYEKLGTVSESISYLNKYFWAMKQRKDKVASNIIQSPTLTSMRENYFNKIVTFYEKVTQATSPTTFDDFFDFWILEDVLKYRNKSDRGESYGIYALHQKQEVYFINPLNHPNVIVQGEVTFSFLSCHNVHRYSSTLSALTSPFDNVTWIVILLTFTSLTILGDQRGSNSNMLLLRGLFSFGICVENSVLSAYQSRLFGRQRYPTEKLVTGLFAILIGSILTNWYKTCFTKEMIVPAIYTSTWRTAFDVRHFTILIPIDAVLQIPPVNNMKDRDQSSYMFYMFFGMQLQKLIGYEGQSKVFKEYSETAEAFYNGTPDGKVGVIKPAIKPVWYEDVAYFVNNMTICDEVAYMDRAENVVTLLPFLNDNANGKVFLRGDVGFLSTLHGWWSYPIRNSYVWNRIKVMMSSGIYSYWENWFKTVKPIKLFHHYANWTYPKVDTVAKLDFSSKISTAFYICGICLVVSIFALVWEIFH